MHEKKKKEISWKNFFYQAIGKPLLNIITKFEKIKFCQFCSFINNKSNLMASVFCNDQEIGNFSKEFSQKLVKNLVDPPSITKEENNSPVYSKPFHLNKSHSEIVKVRTFSHENFFDEFRTCQNFELYSLSEEANYKKDDFSEKFTLIISNPTENELKLIEEIQRFETKMIKLEDLPGKLPQIIENTVCNDVIMKNINEIFEEEAGEKIKTEESFKENINLENQNRGDFEDIEDSEEVFEDNFKTARIQNYLNIPKPEINNLLNPSFSKNELQNRSTIENPIEQLSLINNDVNSNVVQELKDEGNHEIEEIKKDYNKSIHENFETLKIYTKDLESIEKNPNSNEFPNEKAINFEKSNTNSAYDSQTIDSATKNFDQFESNNDSNIIKSEFKNDEIIESNANEYVYRSESNSPELDDRKEGIEENLEDYKTQTAKFFEKLETIENILEENKENFRDSDLTENMENLDEEIEDNRCGIIKQFITDNKFNDFKIDQKEVSKESIEITEKSTIDSSNNIPIKPKERPIYREGYLYKKGSSFLTGWQVS